jgi:hypothetical protein
MEQVHSVGKTYITLVVVVTYTLRVLWTNSKSRCLFIVSWLPACRLSSRLTKEASSPCRRMKYTYGERERRLRKSSLVEEITEGGSYAPF